MGVVASARYPWSNEKENIDRSGEFGGLVEVSGMCASLVSVDALSSQFFSCD